MDYTTYETPIVEMQIVEDVQYIPLIEETMTWVETWEPEFRALAQEVWNEYVGDPSLLTEESYAALDSVVFNLIDPTYDEEQYAEADISGTTED